MSNFGAGLGGGARAGGNRDTFICRGQRWLGVGTEPPCVEAFGQSATLVRVFTELLTSSMTKYIRI